MKYLNDLRFIIGLFFLIVSLILIFTGFFVHNSPLTDQSGNLNLYTGIGMLTFSALMLAASIANHQDS